jgi:hypothetical protein
MLKQVQHDREGLQMAMSDNRIHRGRVMRAAAAIAIMLILMCFGSPAFAQQCPAVSRSGADAPSEVQTSTGRLVYHDDIRKWFELKLDKPKCGEHSLQLVPSGGNWTLLETLRGCRVQTAGRISYSPTGYYSLDLYQDANPIRPIGNCLRKRALPDFSMARPDPNVRAYTVEMHVNYGPGDHPIIFHVRSAGRELKPWQAYASYMLTGGFVLYGFCAEGFVVDKVFGTPAARPGHFDDPRTPFDSAMFDPETAASLGKRDLRLGYTCIRQPTTKR